MVVACRGLGSGVVWSCCLRVVVVLWSCCPFGRDWWCLCSLLLWPVALVVSSVMSGPFPVFLGSRGPWFVRVVRAPSAPSGLLPRAVRVRVSLPRPFGVGGWARVRVPSVVALFSSPSVVPIIPWPFLPVSLRRAPVCFRGSRDDGFSLALLRSFRYLLLRRSSLGFSCWCLGVLLF